MANYGLIDAYLDDLVVALRWHRHADDIIAETDDHLRCAVERRIGGGIGGGIDAEAAQRDVLEGFGDPALVARAFATTRSGRLALPTRSTRDAGVLAFVSAGLWVAVPVVWHLGGWLYDRLDDGTSAADEVGSNAQLLVIGVMAMTLLGAAATLLATTLILRERHGGFGLGGTVGIAATALGAAASLFGWFLIGWGGLLIAGTALVAVDLWHRGIAPKRAILATGAGFTIGGVAWAVLRISKVGGPDQHGDYLVANAAGLVIGSIILATGLFGIGRWLANEEPVELPDPTHLARA
jgi:hypothetical protein